MTINGHRAKQRSQSPKFAIRIDAGLVTHWQNEPLTTYEEAQACRDAIQEHTGEVGEIEEVLLHA